MVRVTIRTAFFRTLSEAALNSVDEYCKAMESQLTLMKQTDLSTRTNEVRGLGLSDEDARAEWDVAMQEHAATHDMLFPNFFRYSAVTLLTLVLEDWLHRLCAVVKEVRAVKGPVPEPHNGALQKYRTYLEDAGVSVSADLWRSVEELNLVRNCIVHASGSVRRRSEKDRKSIQELASRRVGIKSAAIQIAASHNPCIWSVECLS